MKGRSSEKHKQSESGRIGFDVWVRLMWTAQCSVLKQSCVWRGEEGGRDEERCLSRLKMTRWESAAAPFFPVIVREGDGYYVT